jgi:hypothetical protein
MPGQVVQQHGLAHSRLAAEHQYPALTGPDSVDEPVERPHFGGPAPEQSGTSWRTAFCGHRPDVRPLS